MWHQGTRIHKQTNKQRGSTCGGTDTRGSTTLCSLQSLICNASEYMARTWSWSEMFRDMWKSVCKVILWQGHRATVIWSLGLYIHLLFCTSSPFFLYTTIPPLLLLALYQVDCSNSKSWIILGLLTWLTLILECCFCGSTQELIQQSLNSYVCMLRHRAVWLVLFDSPCSGLTSQTCLIIGRHESPWSVNELPNHIDWTRIEVFQCCFFSSWKCSPVRLGAVRDNYRRVHLFSHYYRLLWIMHGAIMLHGSAASRHFQIGMWCIPVFPQQLINLFMFCPWNNDPAIKWHQMSHLRRQGVQNSCLSPIFGPLKF